jgi:ubiquinone/menaquinone biosynthesis C-methylase UbiE
MEDKKAMTDTQLDVVISNCDINLSVDQPTVLIEMYRVLTPGARANPRC